MTETIKLTFLASILLSSFECQTSQWLKRFDIRPGACIVDESERQCIRSFEFYWQLNKAQPVCIYNKGLQKPLYCSKNDIEGTAFIKLNIKSNNEFILVSQLAPNLKAHRQVLVHLLGKDVRKARRHLWSVF